jgi:hypothetical protein
MKSYSSSAESHQSTEGIDSECMIRYLDAAGLRQQALFMALEGKINLCSSDKIAVELTCRLAPLRSGVRFSFLAMASFGGEKEDFLTFDSATV